MKKFKTKKRIISFIALVLCVLMKSPIQAGGGRIDLYTADSSNGIYRVGDEVTVFAQVLLVAGGSPSVGEKVEFRIKDPKPDESCVTNSEVTDELGLISATCVKTEAEELTHMTVYVHSLDKGDDSAVRLLNFRPLPTVTPTTEVILTNTPTLVPTSILSPTLKLTTKPTLKPSATVSILSPSVSPNDGDGSAAVSDNNNTLLLLAFFVVVMGLGVITALMIKNKKLSANMSSAAIEKDKIQELETKIKDVNQANQSNLQSESNRNSQIKRLVVIIVIMVLVATLSILLLVQQQQNRLNNDPSQVSTAVKSSPTTPVQHSSSGFPAWKHYDNQEYEFSVPYPGNWYLVTDTENPTYIIGFGKNRPDSADIYFAIMDNPQNLSLEDFFQHREDTSAMSMPNPFEGDFPIEYLVIDGKRAVKIIEPGVVYTEEIVVQLDKKILLMARNLDGEGKTIDKEAEEVFNYMVRMMEVNSSGLPLQGVACTGDMVTDLDAGFSIQCPSNLTLYTYEDRELDYNNLHRKMMYFCETAIDTRPSTGFVRCSNGIFVWANGDGWGSSCAPENQSTIQLDGEEHSICKNSNGFYLFAGDMSEESTSSKFYISGHYSETFTQEDALQMLRTFQTF